MVTRAQDTVIVELFTRVVLVNILAMTPELVDRVLDGPDTPGRRMLSNTNGISQAPTNEMAIEKVERRVPGPNLRNVIAANLRMPTGYVTGVVILVGVAAARDEKCIWLFVGHEQRASSMVRVAHVGDESEVRRQVDRDGLAIVGEGINAGGCGDVDGFAIA